MIKIELKRSILLLFVPKKMEKQRLQILAHIVKKENSMWKGIPPGPRYTFYEIIDALKNNKTRSIYVDMNAYESLEFVLGEKKAKKIFAENKENREKSDQEFITNLDKELKQAEKEYGN